MFSIFMILFKGASWSPATEKYALVMQGENQELFRHTVCQIQEIKGSRSVHWKLRHQLYFPPIYTFARFTRCLQIFTNDKAENEPISLKLTWKTKARQHCLVKLPCIREWKTFTVEPSTTMHLP
jgi:hypothetical protein